MAFHEGTNVEQEPSTTTIQLPEEQELRHELRERLHQLGDKTARGEDEEQSAVQSFILRELLEKGSVEYNRIIEGLQPLEQAHFNPAAVVEAWNVIHGFVTSHKADV